MEYKLYRGYILGPGYQNPAYDIYEVDIFLHKEDVESGNVYHTSESEWEAQLWLDGGPVDGTASQADVDELNRAAPKTFTKDFDLYPGDKVRITMPAQEPFPAGWAKGYVINANFYNTDGWYIEFEKEVVSPGWQTGYGYWKQGQDGGTVEKL